MSIFSDNLRFLRKKAGLNQQDISVLFGKGANTIGNWENQKSEPSLNEIIKLGDFFKVNTADLLNRPLESDYVHASRSSLPPKAQSATYIIGNRESIKEDRENIKKDRESITEEGNIREGWQNIKEDGESNMSGERRQDPLAAIFRELREIRGSLGMLNKEIEIVARGIQTINKGIETVSFRSSSDKSYH